MHLGKAQKNNKNCTKYICERSTIGNNLIDWLNNVYEYENLWDDEKGDKTWLHKVRPWWGHHYHFHVRLNCPEGSPGCIEQDDPPSGDGCQDARDWVADILNPPPPDPNAPKPKPRKELVLTDLPSQCVGVLKSN